MKNLTPRDITQLVFGVIVVVLFFYLIVPHGTSIRKKINAQQEYIQQLSQKERERMLADSIHDIYYQKRIAQLDSTIKVGDIKDKEYEKQIRLLWHNNYELQKDYDSLRLLRPVLPDL